MESEFFRWDIWAPTSLGHIKFEVKIFLEFFHLQSTVDSEFSTGGVRAPTSFGHAKFEVKNFFEFFHLECSVV